MNTQTTTVVCVAPEPGNANANANKKVCPACGSSNSCTLADPRTADQACWCFSVTIDPAVIAALPDELRNKACLCPRCAGINQASEKTL